MKYFLVCIVSIFTSTFITIGQIPSIPALKNAYYSWKRNKPLLIEAQAELAQKNSDLNAAEKNNIIKIESLRREKEKVRQEMLQGYYCDQCNKSKTEIEAGGKSFEQHLIDVNGKRIPASQSIINARMAEFDQKIADLEYEITKLKSDVFMLDGKVNNYKAFVSSNISAANKCVNDINSYLSNNIEKFISSKNIESTELSSITTDVNSRIVNINEKCNGLKILNDNLKRTKNKLNQEYKGKLSTLQRDSMMFISKLSNDSAVNKKNEDFYMQRQQIENSHLAELNILNEEYSSKKKKLEEDLALNLNIIDSNVSKCLTHKTHLLKISEDFIKLKNDYISNENIIKTIISEMNLESTIVISLTVFLTPITIPSINIDNAINSNCNSYNIYDKLSSLKKEINICISTAFAIESLKSSFPVR